MVSHPLLSLVVLSFLAAGCATNREIGKNLELATGRHQSGSAFDGDYLVQRGATLHIDYASGCRFYVQSGAKLEGLQQGVRDCVVFAEPNASLPGNSRLQRVVVKSAQKAYTDRDRIVDLEIGAGGGGRLISGGGYYHHHYSDDDDDDDDDYRRRSSRIRDVKISDSSYKKKP